VWGVQLELEEGLARMLDILEMAEVELAVAPAQATPSLVAASPIAAGSPAPLERSYEHHGMDVTLVCPAGMKGGETTTVALESGVVQIEIPAGVSAGEHFDVFVPQTTPRTPLPAHLQTSPQAASPMVDLSGYATVTVPADGKEVTLNLPDGRKVSAVPADGAAEDRRRSGGGAPCTATYYV